MSNLEAYDAHYICICWTIEQFCENFRTGLKDIVWNSEVDMDG
jgi:hypothetical protein